MKRARPPVGAMSAVRAWEVDQVVDDRGGRPDRLGQASGASRISSSGSLAVWQARDTDFVQLHASVVAAELAGERLQRGTPSVPARSPAGSTSSGQHDLLSCF